MLKYKNVDSHFSSRFGTFDVRDSHRNVKQTADRLSSSLMQVKELKKKENDLQQDLNSLQNRYDKLLKGSMQVMWDYCTQKSPDILHIPTCDPHLTGTCFLSSHFTYNYFTDKVISS